MIDSTKPTGRRLDSVQLDGQALLSKLIFSPPPKPCNSANAIRGSHLEKACMQEYKRVGEKMFLNPEGGGFLQRQRPEKYNKNAVPYSKKKIPLRGKK